MRKLFFCDKPIQAKLITESFADKGDGFVIIPSVVSYKFKYPLDLSYSEYPYHNVLLNYKINPDCKMFDLMIIDDNGTLIKVDNNINSELHLLFNNLIQYKSSIRTENIKQSRDKIKEYFKSFDELVVATDNDYSGVRAFDLYIQYFINESNSSNLINNATRMLIDRLDHKSIKNSFLKRELYNYSSNVINDRNTYKNKDFFNYIFNINSLLVFNKTLKNIGLCNDNFIITYNMIQSLLILKKNNLNEINFFSNLEKLNVGSYASRNEIFKLLINYNLIENNYHLTLTARGIQFVELIHNKINSLDPNNLYNDFKNMDHEEFKLKYATKLKKYFKKQKNFLNKSEY